jgi:hypothetical protein
MVPLHKSGIIIMPLLIENQLTDIVDMIVDDYGPRLTGSEVSVTAALVLEDICGFKTFDSQALTQIINEIRRLYNVRALRVRPNIPMKCATWPHVSRAN